MASFAHNKAALVGVEMRSRSSARDVTAALEARGDALRVPLVQFYFDALEGRLRREQLEELQRAIVRRFRAGGVLLVELDHHDGRNYRDVEVSWEAVPRPLRELRQYLDPLFLRKAGAGEAVADERMLWDERHEFCVVLLSAFRPRAESAEKQREIMVDRFRNVV